jgi:hypothetical protein
MTQEELDARRIELQQKLSSVDGEFARWHDDSAQGKLLRKHHFQVRRITDVLSGAIGKIRSDLDALQPAGTDLDQRLQKIHLAILEVHRIWEYFRSKLIFRYVEWFASYLEAADEFAWACYKPARDHAAVPEKMKEPPLVYFNGGASPLTMVRGSQYQLEPSVDGTISADRLAPVLESLPIPVIGVPWYQVRYVPELGVIAHEVGHAVEHDLGLTKRIAELISDAAVPPARPSRVPAWRKWAAEIFADIYGVLSIGPAFVSTMASFLDGDPQQLAAEGRGVQPVAVGAYPPASLRVRIGITVVEFLGLADQAVTLRERWVTRHATHAMTAYEPDMDPIVRAMVDGPYPELSTSGSLRAMLDFGPQRQATVADTGKQLLNGIDPTTSDVRELVAAGRVAFDLSPATFAAQGPDGRDGNERLLVAILARRNEDVRGEAGRLGDPRDTDRQLGEGVLDDLYRAHEEDATDGPPD